MGFGAFLIYVFVVVLLAWLATWAIAHLLPGTPAIIPSLIWIVAVLILVVTLLRAMGLLGADPAIPRL